MEQTPATEERTGSVAFVLGVSHSGGNVGTVQEARPVAVDPPWRVCYQPAVIPPARPAQAEGRSGQRVCLMQIAQKPQRTRGIRRKLLGLALLPATLLAGCQTGEGTGALVGGGAGALAGNVIAKATHGSRTAGTVIGGAVGAIGGALAGSAHDKSVQDAEVRGAAQVQAAAQAQQGDIVEIARLARQGVSEAVMINQVRTSGRIYTLTANDILYLKDNTVPETVIA